MKKSHLINIFKTFSKKDIRDLRKWINSPAHNTREDSVLLFEYILKTIVDEDEKGLSKDIAFFYVYLDEKEYSDAKMRQSMYFLLKSIEEFLIYQEFREDEVRSELLLARALGKRKLEKPFYKTLQNAKAKNLKRVLRNVDYHRKKFEILDEVLTFERKKSKVLRTDLQEISNSFDIDFLSHKLGIICSLVSYQKVKKVEYEIGLKDEVLKYIEDNNLLEIPSIGLYYYIYKSLTEKDDKYFFKIKEYIFQYDSLFSRAEMEGVYTDAINYCIRKLNQFEDSFWREVFELYRRGYETKILISNNEISEFAYINTIRAGIKIEELDWVEDFLLSYKKYLHPKGRESIYNYCLATLHHHKKDFNEAMKLLALVAHDNVLFTISAKVFLLKLYYEQDEFNALSSLLESLNVYIRRKEVVPYYQAKFKNLIKYTKKMTKVNPYDKKDIKSLKEEIQEVDNIAEKKWFLEQLDKL